MRRLTDVYSCIKRQPTPKGQHEADGGSIPGRCGFHRASGDVADVCKKKISGCLACEYCHTKGNGACVQKDDMQEICQLLQEADMLVIASPIYYHGITGQLKCVIDRFYAAAYPKKPPRLKKAAMILSSGDLDMYDGALFSFKGDFLDYLGLENLGVFTAHGAENGSAKKLEELRQFGASLK